MDAFAKPSKEYQLFSEESLYRFPPENNTYTYKNEHTKLFGHELKKITQAVYCKVYQDVCVVSKGSATVKGKLVLESVHYDSPSRLLQYKTRVRSALYQTIKKISKAILVTDDYSVGYFHWTADVLSRIVALQKFCQSNKEWKNASIIVPHVCNKAYCKQSLLMLGIDFDKQCVIVPKGKKIEVKNLLTLGDVVPPYGSGNYRPQLIQSLRGSMHKYLKANKIRSPISATKIYISRKDAKYRYLKNEEALIPLLKSYGFFMVQMSDYSFLEQVAICANADVLFSLHGAGLTNIMWMNKNTKLIEIRRKDDFINNCYFSLASALDIKYYYMLAQTSSKHTQKTNFILNHSHVSQILSQILVKK